LEWIEKHDVVLAWMAGTGLLVFVGSLVMIPLIIAYMPADYFVRIDRGPLKRSPLRQVLHVLKNLLGALLIAGGLLMLVLPGQGLLTMVIGLSLIDFPGKRNLEVRLVRMPKVHRSINWIRHRAGRPPILIPEAHGGMSTVIEPERKP